MQLMNHMAKKTVKEVEKTMELGSLDPVEILGVNNALLYKLMAGFPDLRVVARGSIIRAIGASDSVNAFECASYIAYGSCCDVEIILNRVEALEQHFSSACKI